MRKGNRETERLRCLIEKCEEQYSTLRSFQLAVLRNESSWSYCVVAPASPFDLSSSVNVFGVGTVEDNVELYDNMFRGNSEMYQLVSLCMLEVNTSLNQMLHILKVLCQQYVTTLHRSSHFRNTSSVPSSWPFVVCAILMDVIAPSIWNHIWSECICWSR